MKISRRGRWILGGGVVIALVALSMRPAVIQVESAAVRRDSLSEVIAEEGRTRARDRYVIASPITGSLARPRIEAGARVARGGVLATVTPAPMDARDEAGTRAAYRQAEARLEQARAGVANADAAYALADRELARHRALFEEGAVSHTELERSERAMQNALAARSGERAALVAAQAAVDGAQAALIGVSSAANSVEGGRGAIEIRAPSAGTVLRVLQQSERLVVAGTPLFEIADPAGLEVVVELLTEEAMRVPVGAPMRLTGWGGDSALSARVRLVEPAAFTKVSALGVEEQRVNVVGDLAERPKGLGTGYRLQADIVTWAGENVLVAPMTALFRRNAGWYAFVIVDGRARLRALRVGHRGIDYAEILEGLAVEDQVILFPSDLIADGVRVKQ